MAKDEYADWNPSDVHQAIEAAIPSPVRETTDTRITEIRRIFNSVDRADLIHVFGERDMVALGPYP
jgi:hypothetical protein